MDEPDDLPFRVGHFAESKSFEKGYRGAWFRCKIKEISRRKGKILYLLEFYDFVDEAAEWTELYQLPCHGKKGKMYAKHLMVRPQYPPMYHQDKVPDINSLSEVSVVVEGSYKVGNLVDWREEDCYWTGRVTKVLDNDKVKIELPMPPAGEGKSYDAFCKDLRPSLDWLPKIGWTVPALEGGITRCARLVYPAKPDHVAVSNLKIPVTDEGPRVVQAPAVSSLNKASISSHVSANSLPSLSKLKTKRGPPPKPLTTTVPDDVPVTNMDLDVPEISSHVSSANSLPSRGKSKTRKRTSPKPSTTTVFEDVPVTNMDLDVGETSSRLEENSVPSQGELKTRRRDPLNPLTTTISEDVPMTSMDLDVGENASGKLSSIDSISTPHVRDGTVAETSGDASTENIFELPLNSMASNTLEAAIMDLEELANKIKWIKAILEMGTTPMSNESRPAWRFEEHHASNAPD